MTKLLIDECLHTSLLDLAHTAGYAGEHVNYLGLGSSKDWEVVEVDYSGKEIECRQYPLPPG